MAAPDFNRSVLLFMKFELKPKNKIFGYILLCFYMVLILLIYKVLIPENLLTLGVVYITISVGILLLIIFHSLYIFIYLKRKITITRESLTIKKPFSFLEIQWPDTTEFIKQEKGFGLWAGWKYLLKFNRNSEKQIQIADQNEFADIHMLIYLIFRYATGAKFLEIRNDTLIPFIKNYKISKWENK